MRDEGWRNVGFSNEMNVIWGGGTVVVVVLSNDAGEYKNQKIRTKSATLNYKLHYARLWGMDNEKRRKKTKKGERMHGKTNGMKSYANEEQEK